MPTPVLPFVAQCKFPENPNPIVLFRAHSGIRVPDYHVPNKRTEKGITDIANAVMDYDENPTPLNQAKLTQILSDVGFAATRVPPNDPNDPNLVYFYPVGKKNGEPVINDYNVGFVYRFGAMKIPGKPATFDNLVGNNIEVLPHEGTDNAMNDGYTDFMTRKDKVLLINVAHQDSSKEQSSFQKGKNAANVSHAYTLFVPLLKAFIKRYPTVTGTIEHGLADFIKVHGKRKKRVMWTWIINGYNSNFNLRTKSKPTLDTIAYAQYYDVDDAKHIAIGSDLPYRIVYKDKKTGKDVSVKLTNEITNPNRYFSLLKPAPVTDVPAHIFNGSSNGKLRGNWWDRVTHSEHGNKARDLDGAWGDKHRSAQLLSQYFYERWDDRVHTLDPNKLPPEVVANILLFKPWFDNQLKLLPALDAAAPRTSARIAELATVSAAMAPISDPDGDNYVEVDYDSDGSFGGIDQGEDDDIDLPALAGATSSTSASDSDPGTDSVSVSPLVWSTPVPPVAFTPNRKRTADAPAASLSTAPLPPTTRARIGN